MSAADVLMRVNLDYPPPESVVMMMVMVMKNIDGKEQVENEDEYKNIVGRQVEESSGELSWLCHEEGQQYLQLLTDFPGEPPEGSVGHKALRFSTLHMWNVPHLPIG
jgi:hypothetical protein